MPDQQPRREHGRDEQEREPVEAESADAGQRTVYAGARPLPDFMDVHHDDNDYEKDEPEPLGLVDGHSEHPVSSPHVGHSSMSKTVFGDTSS
jgi:hypothetical protein